jgi:hypothetical protein
LLSQVFPGLQSGGVTLEVFMEVFTHCWVFVL